jgi:hypothetical protein
MKMRSLLCAAPALAALLTATVLGWAQAAKGPEETTAAGAGGKIEALSLAVGETRTLSAKGVRNYSLGLSELVDTRITPDGSQFVLVGKKTGTTTLLLIHDDGKRSSYEIQVTERSQAAVENELGALLEGESGVNFRRIGGRFFLEGSVGSDAELKRIQRMGGCIPNRCSRWSRSAVARLPTAACSYASTSSSCSTTRARATAWAWPGRKRTG